MGGGAYNAHSTSESTVVAFMGCLSCRVEGGKRKAVRGVRTWFTFREGRRIPTALGVKCAG